MKKFKAAQSSKSKLVSLMFNHVNHYSLLAAHYKDGPSPESETSWRTLSRPSVIQAHIILIYCVNAVPSGFKLKSTFNLHTSVLCVT